MDIPVSTREFRLTPGEYRRLLRRLQWRRWVVPLLFGGLAVVYLALAGSDLSLPSLVGGFLGQLPWILALAAWAAWLLLVQPWWGAKRRAARGLYGNQRYTFDERGVSLELEDGSHLHRPPEAVVDASRLAGCLLLRQDTGGLFVIPERAFDGDAALEAVAGRFRSSGEPGERTEGSGGPLLAGLARNLRAGIRLMTFRRVARDDFVADGGQLLLLASVSVVVTIAVDRLLTDGAVVRFNAYALQQDGLQYLMLLAAAYLAARARGGVAALPLFLVALVSPEPLFSILNAPLYHGVDLGSDAATWALYVVAFLWGLAVWWRSAGLALGGGAVAASATLVMLFVVAVLPWFWLPDQTYWYADEAVTEVDVPTVNMERLFYRQPQLVDEAVARLAKERPGVADLYHIGFGGYASQQVFRRELGHVRRVLDDRFDTGGRSLVMINDPREAEAAPIASSSNLRLALSELGRRINPEEDVLFLYLTSHGSRTAELSLEFRPLELNPLTAYDLRKMLDDAGIRWRVVVISACYSGSFMNQLKDDHTLVITAASPFRTSFGCGNEFDYTYFGEAYFRDALRHTRSFTEAFALARERVAARERREGIEPSQPMMFVGEAIGPYLGRLERRLARLHEGPPVAERACGGGNACEGGAAGPGDRGDPPGLPRPPDIR